MKNEFMYAVHPSIHWKFGVKSCYEYSNSTLTSPRVRIQMPASVTHETYFRITTSPGHMQFNRMKNDSTQEPT